MYEGEPPPREKRHNKLATTRALRTHLRQHLGWMAGYPLQRLGGALIWRTWPGENGPPVDLVVERPRVRAAAQGVRLIERQFPRALPRLVGDVDAWRAEVGARLELLRGALEQTGPLPVPRVDRAWEELRRSSTAAVFDALAWLSFDAEFARSLDPNDVQQRLQGWRGALVRVENALGSGVARELAVALVLSAPAREAEGGVRDVLASADAFELATDDDRFAQALEDRIEAARTDRHARSMLLSTPTPRPAGRLGHELVDILLARHDAETRALLDALVAAAPLDGWRLHWARAAELEREARSEVGRLVTRHAPGLDVKQCLGRWRDECRRELGHQPLSWSVQDEVARANNFFQSCSRKVRGELLAALLETAPMLRRAAIDPDAGDVRQFDLARLLSKWQSFLAESPSVARVTTLVALQRRAVRTASSDADAAFRVRALCSFLIDAYLEPRKLEWEHCEVAYKALDIHCSRSDTTRRLVGGGSDYRDRRRFISIIQGCAEVHAGEPSERIATCVVDYMVASSASDRNPDGLLLARLGPDPVDDTQFWRHAPPLLAQSWSDGSALRDLARTPAIASLLCELVRDGAVAKLQELARLVRVLQSFGVDVAPPVQPAGRPLGNPPGQQPGPGPGSAVNLEWVPESLQTLATAVLAEEGARALDHALRDHCVRPERLQQEIAALASLDARTQHQERRLVGLRDRVANRPQLTPTELARCRARLQRRVRARALDRWLVSLRQRLATCLPPAMLPLLDDPRMQPYVAALAQERPNVRELAWRVLAREDLSHEPAHVAWRARMEAAGVELGPWLQPDLEMQVASPRGTLTLRIEQDPTEIVQMGQWFDTCLSPGDFNFFSVVANAADANKRVLVGRDGRGKAQLRCLMALTDEGRLLGFHVYAHADPEGARDAVRRFACELAARMRTTFVSHGKVATLVAPRWYDDGPIDLVGNLAALDEGGAAASALQAAPPEAAAEVLAATLGPDLLEAELEQLVGHDVILRAPARLLSLVRHFPGHRWRTRTALMVAVALRSVECEAARTMLVDVFERQRGRLRGLYDEERVQFALALHDVGESSRALRVLRRCRSETRLERAALRTVLLALGRTNEAALHQAPGD